MSSYIDLKYISNLKSRLSQFKQKNDYLFNFRCPHCGDSKKSKLKSRAYLYRVKNDMFFNIEYTGLDLNGNRYSLKSEEASLDNLKPEVVYMNIVNATFYFTATPQHICPHVQVSGQKFVSLISFDVPVAKFSSPEIFLVCFKAHHFLLNLVRCRKGRRLL